MCLASNEPGGPRRCAGETRSTYHRRQQSLDTIEQSHQHLLGAINQDAPPFGHSSPPSGAGPDEGILSMATAHDRHQTKSYYEGRDRGRAQHAEQDLAECPDPPGAPRPGAAELEAQGWPIEGGWIEPRGNGRIGNLETVDIPKLLALYEAEGAEDAPDGVYTNKFNDAFNAADLHTQQAWRIGYGNPRVTNRGESVPKRR